MDTGIELCPSANYADDRTSLCYPSWLQHFTVALIQQIIHYGLQIHFKITIF